MKPGRIFKGGEVIEMPSLTAVIEKERGWFVSTCPELGVASQGKTRKEAYAMLAEAVELWLQAASTKEIKRRLKLGASVQPLELAIGYTSLLTNEAPPSTTRLVPVT